MGFILLLLVVISHAQTECVRLNRACFTFSLVVHCSLDVWGVDVPTRPESRGGVALMHEKESAKRSPCGAWIQSDVFLL